MKGTYCLVLKLNKNEWIKIGSARIGFFPKGFYVYVGSALNSLEKRIERHKRKQKKFHWHIDYFLKKAKIIGTRQKISGKKLECSLARKVQALGGEIVFQKFGCTDCSCESHLFKFKSNPLKNRKFNKLWDAK